jgi:glucan 1,3-beta-glucosidase
MPAGAGDGPAKLYCVSYAPFRGTQTPLDPATMVSAAQIDDDLARLARVSDCVRTYSVDFGLDQIAGIAARHGLKVIQGLWLSSNAGRSREQIDIAIALANKHPDTIRAVVVGNEVLLRGEMSAVDLAAILREVKSKVRVPVTYADVWEFWLRNRELASVADFITIHILPYWEDLPIPAKHAAAHVDAIRARLAEAFPGKEILIGEVGWPSAGRMREGALPSLSNEALVIQGVLAAARRGNYRANIIEAFDAPWKRALEGTVGGHWGLFDDATRAEKFQLGAPVSDHPYWQWQAAGGIALAALTFVVASMARRRDDATLAHWLAVFTIATVSGVTAGWAVENMPVESLGPVGWLRTSVTALLALAAAPACAAAIMGGATLPSFATMLNRAACRELSRLERLCGIIKIGVTVMAIMAALGLVFDPRYRDFPFAPMTAAVLPLLAVSLLTPVAAGGRAVAEALAAALLAVAVVYIVPNEGPSNWQSLWLCGALAVLALTLSRARAAPG